MKKQVSILKGVFAAAVGFAVVGCGAQNEEPSAAKPAPAEEKVLTVFTWEDYFDVETLAAFEEKAGAKVVYETFESTDEMEAKLLSRPGVYDVVIAEGQVLQEMGDLHLVRDLDHSKLPNIKNIGEQFQKMPFDPGNRVTAPYTWGSTLVAYRTDIIEDPEKSWSLLWDERLKGKVMLYDERHEVIRIPLFSLGYSLNTAEPKHIAEATDLLLKRVEQSGARFGSDADVREGLKDGTLWAATCYSGDAAMVGEENENIGWFIPEEGAPLWMDCFAITKHSRNSELAHEFVNHMMDAKISAQNMNYLWYPSPIAGAEEFIDPELLEDEALNPSAEVMEERCQWYKKLDAAREEMLNQGWLRVLNKVRERAVTAATGNGEPAE